MLRENVKTLRKLNLNKYLFLSRNPNTGENSDSQSDPLIWEAYDPTKKRYLYIGV